ncbi:MAG: transporter permease [Firmicutes bacterium]|nr:transporter permease [Bacillota bacterium]
MMALAGGIKLLLTPTRHISFEMIAAKEGIGVYDDLMLTTNLMVGILTLSLLGVVFNHFLQWVERRVISWEN